MVDGPSERLLEADGAPLVLPRQHGERLASQNPEGGHGVEKTVGGFV